jgi:hypothetical protein
MSAPENEVIAETEKQITFMEFTNDEAIHQSMTQIIHMCSLCGNNLPFSVVITALDRIPYGQDNEISISDDALPFVIGVCCYNNK